MSRMFSVLRVALIALACGGSLCGCGSPVGMADVSSGGSITNIPNADGRAVPARTNLPSLKLSISTDKATYRAGEPIHTTISVTNADSAPHAISFTTGSHATWWGYMVTLNGKIVSYEYWPGHKQAFAQVVGTDSYTPGETHTFPYDFPYVPSPDSPPQVSVLPPGTYQIYARYPDTLFDGGTPVNSGVPTPVSDPVTITVTN